VNIHTNGLSIHVQDSGSGPAVLLLHGVPDSTHLWRHQIPVLNAAGFRTIAPDLRGFGQSDRPTDTAAYALPNIIADVVGILDELDVPRVHVVGHDWGATIGWAMAAMMPDRVESLVAFTVGHPSGFFADPMAQRERSWYMLFFQTPGVAEEALRRDGCQLFRQLLRESGDLERYLLDLERPGALTAVLSWYRANLSAEAFGAANPIPLPPVACPVMGVWAAGDAYLTEAQMVASASHCLGPWRYERLEGVDHWIPIAAPETTNRLLLDFLGVASTNATPVGQVEQVQPRVRILCASHDDIFGLEPDL